LPKKKSKKNKKKIKKKKKKKKKNPPHNKKKKKKKKKTQTTKPKGPFRQYFQPLFFSKKRSKTPIFYIFFHPMSGSFSADFRPRQTKKEPVTAIKRVNETAETAIKTVTF
jgi:hypothetical protein